MTSRSTEGEGSREIEAAKQRLAAAKARAASAAKQMDAATKGVDAANAMLAAAKKNAEAARSTRDNAASLVDSSEEEVKEAEAFLKEAGQKWDATDVDDNDTDDQEEGSRKRQKVDAERISVEGCGSPEVDGTYERSDRLHNGVHLYCKRGGRWKGKAVKFQLWYEAIDNSWIIGCENKRGKVYFYFARDADSAGLPPKNGWKILSRGNGNAKEPAPRLNW
mmetsp:Transcript_52634/g.111793  ORF Transcript_52634/g.111793 Transcript_52634/m.111793 type:complete len:221 (+) Transcript_52634:103-765(+)